MNNKLLISIAFIASFGLQFAMYRPIRVCKVRSSTPSQKRFIFDSEVTQSDVRTPSPALFGFADSLLISRDLSVFAEGFKGLRSITSPVADIDETFFVQAGEAGLKLEGCLSSNQTELMFGSQTTLNDLLDKIDAVADENYGQCAAMFVKGRYASIVAKKDLCWVFVSLDRQSSKKSFGVGSHVAIFNARSDMFSYLDSLCKLLEAQDSSGSWEATFYSKTSIRYTPRCPLFDRK